MRGRITITAVERLRPGQILHDTELVGFMVRRQQDVAVYSVRRRFKGQNLCVTIGRHGTFTPHMARKEAGRLLALMASGHDPRADKAKATGFKEAAEQFLDHIKAKRATGTHREYEGHIRSYLTPRFGNRAIDAITTSELEKLHIQLRDRPTLANRVLDTLSSFYGWSAKPAQRMCPPLFNPASKKLVERYPEEGKERFLTTEELKRLGKALRQLETEGQWSPFALAAIRLLLFTGCRRDDVRLAQWVHVDWERRTLTLPRAKRGRRVAHLNAGAIAVLQGLRALPGTLDAANPYIIRGSKDGEPYKNLWDVWDAVRERAKLEGVRIHDLRHSVASFAGADGASLPIIGALLGHKTVAASKRYTHLAGDPAKLAAERVGETISRGLAAAE